MIEFELYRQMTGIDLVFISNEYKRKTGTFVEPTIPNGFKELYESH